MLRKHALTISFVVTWAVVLGATTHAGIAPQHAPVLGAAPIANSNAKSAPVVAAVLIGDADLGGPNDFLFTYDKTGVNHAGTIATSPVGDATKLEVPLSSMKTGWYASHWNVQSADGHMAGADDGLWWAFGVKGITRAAATKKISLSTPTPVASLPNKISASVNGVRVGTRTISVVLKTGTITSFKWQRLDEVPSTLIGASFPWAVSFQKKTKTFVSPGVIPFSGSYKLTAQITLARNGESHTALWSAVIAVSP